MIGFIKTKNGIATSGDITEADNYASNFYTPETTIIENTADIIYDDSFGPNIGDGSAVTMAYPQFYAAPQTFPLNNNLIPSINAWYEVWEEGDGTSCGASVNSATNTGVELGWLTAHVYYQQGSQWVAWENSRNHGEVIYPWGGSKFPTPNSSDPYTQWENFMGCPQWTPVREAHLDTNVVVGVNASGNGVYKPDWYYRYHGWGAGRHVLEHGNTPRAAMITLYARLVVIDDQLPDDRANARFVIHMGSDRKNLDGSAAGGDIGISRTKRVTNQWQAFNLLTGGWTRSEFKSTNPPINLIP